MNEYIKEIKYGKLDARCILIVDAIINKFINFMPLYRQIECSDGFGSFFTKMEMKSEIVLVSKILRPLYEDIFKEIIYSGRVFEGFVSLKKISVSNCVDKKYRCKVFVGDKRNLGFEGPACIWVSSPEEYCLKRNISNLIIPRGILQISYDDLASSSSVYDHTKLAIPIITLLRSRRMAGIVRSGSSDILIREMINEIYRIESMAKGYFPQDKLKVRMKYSLPIINDLYQYVEANRDRLELLIGQRLCKHFFVHRKEFTAFCYDGFIDVDNAVYDITMKKVFQKYAKGKCILFNDKDLSEAAPIFFSLLGTCMLNGIDPKSWLRYVLLKARGAKGKDISYLSPIHFKRRGFKACLKVTY
ncbi:TPA: hypothetical protein ACKQH2_005287 [Serratia marcescens]